MDACRYAMKEPNHGILLSRNPGTVVQRNCETQLRSVSRPSMSISCRRSVRIALRNLAFRSSMVLSITFNSSFFIVSAKISQGDGICFLEAEKALISAARVIRKESSLSVSLRRAANSRSTVESVKHETDRVGIGEVRLAKCRESGITRGRMREADKRRI